MLIWTEGKPLTEAKDLWTNLHREKPERDRRDILNGPKSYLHKYRKEFNLSEFYEVRGAHAELGSSVAPRLPAHEARTTSARTCTVRAARLPALTMRALSAVVCAGSFTTCMSPGAVR